MEKIKNFLGNITRAGWVVVFLVLAVIVLLIAGLLSAKNDTWPFSPDDVISIVDEDVMDDKKFVDQATETVLSVDDVLEGEYGNTVSDATLFVQNTEMVQVAVISDKAIDGLTLDNGACGNILYATTRVPRKPAILNETLAAMFGDRVMSDVMPGNVIPLNKNLLFERAIIENGEALILLNGSFDSNECLMKNSINQIRFTAMGFDTVNNVAIFINGEEIK